MIRRRETLAGLGAIGVSAMLPAQAASAPPPVRRFDMRLNGKKVGEQLISAELTPSGLAATIEIDLVVRILGIAVWRYNLRARELWRGGKLISLRSRTNDNGRDHFVNARRVTGGVEVQGSKYEGLVKGAPATSTYWSKAFMERPVWINAQHGRPEQISAKLAGKALLTSDIGKIECDVWQTTGKLKLKVFFDQSDECVGCQFDVKDSPVSVVVTELGGDFSRLWDQA